MTKSPLSPTAPAHLVHAVGVADSGDGFGLLAEALLIRGAARVIVQGCPPHGKVDLLGQLGALLPTEVHHGEGLVPLPVPAAAAGECCCSGRSQLTPKAGKPSASEAGSSFRWIKYTALGVYQRPGSELTCRTPRRDPPTPSAPRASPSG